MPENIPVILEPPLVTWHEVAEPGAIDVGLLIGGLVSAFGGRLANWQITDGEAVYVALFTPDGEGDGEALAAVVSGAVEVNGQ